MFGKKKTTRFSAKTGRHLQPQLPSVKKAALFKRKPQAEVQVAPPPPAPKKPAAPLTPKQQQDLKRQKLLEQREKERQKQAELLAQKKAAEANRRKELNRKRRMSLITFTVGLFLMMSALICLFPSTYMIVFSTILMFSFFFLGIAFQRMIMQLLVVAMACVVITGAFFTIIQ